MKEKSEKFSVENLPKEFNFSEFDLLFLEEIYEIDPILVEFALQDPDLFKKKENKEEELKQNAMNKKDPEYMRKAWYKGAIRLGDSHEDAIKYANMKVKEVFGI